MFWKARKRVALLKLLAPAHLEEGGLVTDFTYRYPEAGNEPFNTSPEELELVWSDLP